MSYDDFCRYSPEEFAAICEAYQDQRETEFKDGWEQVRAIVCATLQPHLKNKKATPMTIYPLPWDKKKNAKKTTAAEDKARYDNLMSRLNG